MSYLRTRMTALAAIIYYKAQRKYPPCLKCDIEYNGMRNKPVFQWGTCDTCDWGNQ